MKINETGRTETFETQNGETENLPNEIGGKNETENLPNEIGSKNETENLPDEIERKNETEFIPDETGDAEEKTERETTDSPEKGSPKPIEKDIVKGLKKEYLDDLESKSEYSNTIDKRLFEAADWEKISPEKNSEMREEFDRGKADLKKQWEDVNGMPWPKYEHDVYSANGKLIRKAGSDYDAHHIQPLGMGGKNEVSNITPLSAEVHYDKQGIHSPDSPYSKLDKILGGM